jgi:8-oxo-dGTP pyrophosphatase MutT (NUDIX family)
MRHQGAIFNREKFCMAKLLFGERIGKLGAIRLGCSAVILDTTQDKILLTCRKDNGLWCLPGGAIDPGESVVEACAREVWEETGLRVHVGKLIGVYSNPHQLVEYNDGNRFQIVALNFEAEPISGELGISDETTAVGYFSLPEIEDMDLMEHHRVRIQDVLVGQQAAFVR